MDVSPQPPTQIRDIRSKRMRKNKLDETIPEMERKLTLAIHERASLEAVIIKVEAHELAKNHDGLCGLTIHDVSEEDTALAVGEPCQRNYGHTELHSWEGGGVG